MVVQMWEYIKFNIIVVLKDKEFLVVFMGNVCFLGWKQVFVDYRLLLNNFGVVVVDDCGYLKGIYVFFLNVLKYVLEYIEF